MKNIRGFALGLAAGIAVAIGTVGLAQTTKPADPTTSANSSCATSCCCLGGACAMHTGEMEHAKGQNKHLESQMKQGEGQMRAHTPESCCCGDSCDMQMKMNEKETQKQE